MIVFLFLMCQLEICTTHARAVKGWLCAPRTELSMSWRSAMITWVPEVMQGEGAPPRRFWQRTTGPLCGKMWRNGWEFLTDWLLIYINVLYVYIETELSKNIFQNLNSLILSPLKVFSVLSFLYLKFFVLLIENVWYLLRLMSVPAASNMRPLKRLHPYCIRFMFLRHGLSLVWISLAHFPPLLRAKGTIMMGMCNLL